MKTCQLTLHNDTNPPSLPRRQWLLGSGLGIVALLLTGCGAAPARTSVRSGIRGTRRGSVPDVAAVRPLLLDARQREAAVARAILAINAPYRFGGNTLDAGFDCSGFIGYLFREEAGMNLPRSTREMINVNAPLVARNNLKPGDLLFFSTSGRGRVSHAGIYLGDNQFIHSSSRRSGGVRVDNLGDSYWSKTFIEAKRALAMAPTTVTASK